MVREAGVEPARPCEHRHLKPASLPIPPLAHLLNCRRSSATGHILPQASKNVNNFFKKSFRNFFEKRTCISSPGVVICQSCLANTLGQHPGVAKFGIALEWGSRGLEFESQHSDQKSVSRKRYRFFYFLQPGTQGLLLREAQMQSGLGNQGACAGFP